MRIGQVDIPSQLALAPMAGVTDAAFRQICAGLGAGLTCTELVSAKALCYQGEALCRPDLRQRHPLHGRGGSDRH